MTRPLVKLVQHYLAHIDDAVTLNYRTLGMTEEQSKAAQALVEGLKTTIFPALPYQDVPPVERCSVGASPIRMSEPL